MLQHAGNSEFVANACATLAQLSDIPVVQAVIAKKSSIDSITKALIKNFSDVTLVQQTSHMLANAVKTISDAKSRQVETLPNFARMRRTTV
jgi:hypothetical protein